VKSAEVARTLIEALPALDDANRGLALDALLRDAARADALLQAISDGKVAPDSLGEPRRARLMRHDDAGVRSLAAKLLASGGK
jgi:hypothetical protein